MIITLPFLPPTVNTAFYTDFKSRTRHKNKAYRDFIENCAYHFMGKVKEAYMEDIEVEYNFIFKDKRRRDICNYEKALSDTLVYYGVIKDDSQIKRMVIEGYYKKGVEETVIQIKPYEVLQIV